MKFLLSVSMIFCCVSSSHAQTALRAPENKDIDSLLKRMMPARQKTPLFDSLRMNSLLLSNGIRIGNIIYNMPDFYNKAESSGGGISNNTPPVKRGPGMVYHPPGSAADSGMVYRPPLAGEDAGMVINPPGAKNAR